MVMVRRIKSHPSRHSPHHASSLSPRLRALVRCHFPQLDPISVLLFHLTSLHPCSLPLLFPAVPQACKLPLLHNSAFLASLLIARCHCFRVSFFQLFLHPCLCVCLLFASVVSTSLLKKSPSSNFGWPSPSMFSF